MGLISQGRLSVSTASSAVSKQGPGQPCSSQTPARAITRENDGSGPAALSADSLSQASRSRQKPYTTY